MRRSLPAQIPAAGKTGTTNDNTDVWFIGCTPHLVAGVWLGFDQPQDDHAGGGWRFIRRADLGAIHGGGSGRRLGCTR